MLAALVYHAGIVAAIWNAHASGIGAIRSPFSVEGDRAVGPSSDAARAGLRSGDRILAIDGVPFRNVRHFGDRMASRREGPMRVTVVRSRNTRQDVVIPLHREAVNAGLGSLAMEILIELVNLGTTLVGIYVALMMPYDFRAICVLGIMLSLSQVVRSENWYSFAAPLRDFAFFYQGMTFATWPAALVLFAVYFPSPLAALAKPGRKFLVLAPTVLVTADLLFLSLRPYFDVHAAAWVPDVGRILFAIAISFFFASIYTRLHQPEPADAKRRLRILIVAANVGLIPLGVFVLVDALLPASVSSTFTTVALVPVVLLFFLFPIGLAYIVLAERAMKLRVAIRQGIRYALAKGGLHIVFACLIGLLLLILWNVVARGVQNDPRIRIAVFVVAALVTRALLQRTRSRLQVALDRRFFRDSYNAEQILEELSRQVLSLVREEHIIATVSQRIADALHIENLTVLLEEGSALRPVYALGTTPPAQLLQMPATVEVVREAADPPRVFTDRRDNWIHHIPPDEAASLSHLRPQLLLPVGSQDRFLGLAVLGPKKSEEPYTRTDTQLLLSLMAQTGLALVNSRLASAVAEEAAQRERLNREVEIAREVQERLFPQQLPCIQGVDYAGHCRPALAVGGDYYDFLPLAGGQLGIAIGDVSGKGIAAALLMASLQASLRGQVLSNPGDLARVMSNVNRLVYDATPINRYATFFYGQFDPHTRVLQYVNAGHNPPFIMRRHDDTTVIRLDTGGPVVGLLPNAVYQQGSIVLEPGDVFVGYTDGFSEAENAAEEEWGEERLVAAAAECASLPAATVIPEMLARADQFANGAAQHDDMTLIVLKLSCS